MGPIPSLQYYGLTLVHKLQKIGLMFWPSHNQLFECLCVRCWGWLKFLSGQNLFKSVHFGLYHGVCERITLIFSMRCFCHTVLCRAQLCHSMSFVSVHLSMTFRYHDHIGWKTLKIISWLTSLKYLKCSGWPQQGQSGAMATPQNYGGIGLGSWAQKPAISQKRCKIGPRLLWRTSRKSHTRFQFVPKSRVHFGRLRSLILVRIDTKINGLEWSKCTLAEKIVLWSPSEIFEWR